MDVYPAAITYNITVNQTTCEAMVLDGDCETLLATAAEQVGLAVLYSALPITTTIIAEWTKRSFEYIVNDTDLLNLPLHDPKAMYDYAIGILSNAPDDVVEDVPILRELNVTFYQGWAAANQTLGAMVNSLLAQRAEGLVGGIRAACSAFYEGANTTDLGDFVSCQLDLEGIPK